MLGEREEKRLICIVVKHGKIEQTKEEERFMEVMRGDERLKLPSLRE